MGDLLGKHYGEAFGNEGSNHHEGTDGSMVYGMVGNYVWLDVLYGVRDGVVGAAGGGWTHLVLQVAVAEWWDDAP